MKISYILFHLSCLDPWLGLSQSCSFGFISDASICSKMAFPPLGNSNHVIILVSIDFPSYSKCNAPFYCIAYDYSCTDWTVFVIIWETLQGRISLNSLLLLLLVNFFSGFRLELMYTSLIESMRSNLTDLHVC